LLGVKLALADSPGAGFKNGSLLGFKHVSSFGVKLHLNKRSANGFKDGLRLGIKLGIGSMLDVKLSSTDSPQSKSDQQPMRQRAHTWIRFNS
jgi:hypothetical protein